MNNERRQTIHFNQGTMMRGSHPPQATNPLGTLVAVAKRLLEADKLMPVWLALGLACLTGCQSAKEPGSLSHASVQVPGRSTAEIQQTATTVFKEAGYGLAKSTPEEMIFERPGSRRDALKWGGLATGQGVTMRVKVRLSEPVNGGHLIQADAFAVQDASDPFFQTENRNMMLNHRPYQKLLDEVAKRLKLP